ncbi:hypothetical protein Goshw_002463 [Gossypium schwendimanii]|uniref:Transposase MuDR plant domain-containing protein n=1 Tax=Gossypium schwendimanii TaxID=34291 RepID=A0A7J9MZJ5_GOSSC|nr:hypothetical protein [Gossypium schwendimanii]
MESSGHISLGSTFREDNDSEVAADEYAGDFTTSDGLDNVAATSSREEEDGTETEVWDSDEHNDKLKFSLGMLFNDGKQLKSAIRKYSKECRRQLKFIKNESKRVVVRSKMPRSIIKMVVQRVIVDSLPHFKRHYVCFDALKRGWKVAVVELECPDSWAWFLSLLSTNLGLEYGYGYTIISNQQKVSKYAILNLIVKCGLRGSGRIDVQHWRRKIRMLTII